MKAITIALRPVPGPVFRLGSAAETLAAVAAIGYTEVDVSLSGAAEVRDSRLARLAADAGVRVGSLLTGLARTEGGLSLSDPATAAAARERLGGYLEAAAELGCGVVVGWMVGVFPAGATERDERRALLIDSLGTIAARAEELGVPLLLEPINRYESNVAPTVAEMAMLVAEAGGDIELILDCFHQNIEEADPLATGARYAPMAGLVQVADSNRRMPGDGHFPITAWLKAIHDAGFDGRVSLEALWGSDPEAEARRAYAFLASAEP